jgi:hypothetical protein
MLPLFCWMVDHDLLCEHIVLLPSDILTSYFCNLLIYLFLCVLVKFLRHNFYATLHIKHSVPVSNLLSDVWPSFSFK